MRSGRGIWWAAIFPAILSAQPSADTSWIRLDTVTLGPRHWITLDDIVALREVQETRLSPDGGRVAFVVRQAFRRCNCARAALFVVDTANNSTPIKLVEAGNVSSVRWTPDGRHISYLSDRGGSNALWRSTPGVEGATRVLVHGDTTTRDLLAYEWAPDGQSIAFTTLAQEDSADEDRQRRTGWVYDDETMTAFTALLGGGSRPRETELWLGNVRTGEERVVWRSSPSTLGSTVTGFAWAPNGTQIAISYTVPPPRGAVRWALAGDGALGVVDLPHAAFAMLVEDSTEKGTPVWAPNGGAIAFAATNEGVGGSINVIRPATRSQRVVARLWTDWADVYGWDDGSRVVFAVAGSGRRYEQTGLYAAAVSGREQVERLTPTDLRVGDCDAVAHRRLSCVRESPNEPPSPAFVALRETDLHASRIAPLATINPELSRLQLSPVIERRWTNRFGAETNGYLLLPRDYVVGRRYPMVILAYRYDGWFVTRASPYLTSYPAQALAGNGFVVLLINAPRFDEARTLGFSAMATGFAASPLASEEAAIRQLSKEGLVDAARVGMAGHSYGGLWSEYAITHSDLFRAAEVHNGGSFNPGLYWLYGNATARHGYDRYLGGPPYDSTLANWLAFSPAMNAARVHAPVLMECDPTEGLVGLEMMSALRRHNVPVEFVVYPGEGHVFVQPEHEYYSMERNLDWFTFWLEGREDSDPAKADEYARWRSMRRRIGHMQLLTDTTDQLPRATSMSSLHRR